MALNAGVKLSTPRLWLWSSLSLSSLPCMGLGSLHEAAERRRPATGRRRPATGGLPSPALAASLPLAPLHRDPSFELSTVEGVHCARTLLSTFFQIGRILTAAAVHETGSLSDCIARSVKTVKCASV